MPRVTLDMNRGEFKDVMTLAGADLSITGADLVGRLVEEDGGVWRLDELVHRYAETSAEEFVRHVRESCGDDSGQGVAIADLDDAMEYWMGAGGECVCDDDGSVVVYARLG